MYHGYIMVINRSFVIQVYINIPEHINARTDVNGAVSRYK